MRVVSPLDADFDLRPGARGSLLREFLERSLAQAAGPAIASMLIYVLMAVVLAIRPQGLFPVRHG